MTVDLSRYSSFQHLLFDRPAAGVLRVTINNADKMNAIGGDLGREIIAVWDVIDRDPDTRAAIVTGAGRAFSAGGSIDDMPSGRRDALDVFCKGFDDARALIAAIIGMRKPLVSAINGAAVGAGLAVALLADIPIASKTAKLFDGHLRLGVTPGDHAAMIWPLLCGLAKAKYYLLTNEVLTGEEAERINLVALAVDHDALQDKAVDVAARLAATAPNAMRMSKYVLNHFLRENQTVLDLSLAFEMVNFGSDESNEAIRAMQARETPDFPPPRVEFR
ncbi:enoyl-CoA hydratase/isomerase family protein [Sphingomonas sp. MG17]|uniref:Enoyl-CoA hydratase/isomerase family protein n=1 Tax=Sphingomonas tagetis TaxID=2949092 RepID=A0A9X2HMN7_9SPHN|nr:enoyl-CoA hydratase/isomerase family protein [Sphingomonas tagetis]